MTDKLLITVAPNIPPYIAQGIPGLDLSPEGIAREVVRAANAGANVAHLHVWDEHGQPTMELAAFERALRLIRAGCDIIIEGSTGGVNTRKHEPVASVLLSIGGACIGKPNNKDQQDDYPTRI